MLHTINQKIVGAILVKKKLTKKEIYKNNKTINKILVHILRLFKNICTLKYYNVYLNFVVTVCLKILQCMSKPCCDSVF